MDSTTQKTVYPASSWHPRIELVLLTSLSSQFPSFDRYLTSPVYSSGENLVNSSLSDEDLSSR